MFPLKLCGDRSIERVYSGHFKLVAVRSKGADITELNLEYDKGMLTGQVQLAEAAACPNDIVMQATNLVTGDTSNVETTFDAECRFEAEINVGEYRITFTRRGFDSVNVDSVRIRSFETYDLGARILPRALGTLREFQCKDGEHDGIHMQFANRPIPN